MGQIYLVTFTTHQRQPLFLDYGAARIVARAATDHRLWSRARLLAWVLMPDHWHGLVQLGAFEDLSMLVGRLKTNTSRRLRQPCPRPGPIWSRAFHDHALRREEDLQAVARYIVLNPVRAGLVSRVGDYPYWDAVWL